MYACLYRRKINRIGAIIKAKRVSVIMVLRIFYVKFYLFTWLIYYENIYLSI